MIAINYLQCTCCEGNGYITEETTGNYEPYAQDFRELQCDECNGKGQIIELDEMIARTEHKFDVSHENKLGFIAEAEELIHGLQKRKEIILYSMVALKQMGLETSLTQMYSNRLDTINRGIQRIKHYKQTLLTYETNI